MPITPKNWQSFQHYRDRSPGWIKLHRTLLDNIDYHLLSPDAAKALPLLWLIASEKDGVIPSAPEAAFRLRIGADLAARILAELVLRGFMVEAEHAEQRAAEGAFNSRHISDEVKRAVWARDGGRCCHCGSDENIEYDHKIPVSKGGGADEGNIQLLCRTCNRRKRTAATVEHAAPSKPKPALSRRSLEEERETEGKPETDSRVVAKKATPPRSSSEPSRFDEFWLEYPRRLGANPRAPAEKKFNALVKSLVDPQMMVDAIKKLAIDERAAGHIGTAFIPQAITWLNQQRWADHAAVAFLKEQSDAPAQLESAVRMYAKSGRWSRFAGPEPGMGGCRASAELMAKYGMTPDGRKIQVEPA